MSNSYYQQNPGLFYFPWNSPIHWLASNCCRWWTIGWQIICARKFRRKVSDVEPNLNRKFVKLACAETSQVSFSYDHPFLSVSWPLSIWLRPYYVAQWFQILKTSHKISSFDVISRVFPSKFQQIYIYFHIWRMGSLLKVCQTVTGISMVLSISRIF